MAYKNGQIPTSLLTKTASGTNGDGYWEHLWSPGTLAKWKALVADVLEHEGVELYVTPGWNVYRPLAAQVLAKRKYGPLAAQPGKSSHGGEFGGVESMAIDCANWGRIGKEKFFAYARKHALMPGTFVSEPWHLIDYQPWAQPAGGGGSNAETPNVPDTGEEEMTPQQQKELNDKLDLLIGYLFAGGPAVEAGQGTKKSIFGRLINLDRQVTSADGTFKETSTNARLIRLEQKFDALIEALGK